MTSCNIFIISIKKSVNHDHKVFLLKPVDLDLHCKYRNEILFVGFYLCVNSGKSLTN